MNHYFTDNRHLAQNRKEITFRFSCFTCHFITDNGVFSKDHVDHGSRVLLEAVHASGKLGEAVLDLGCGYGVIGITLKKAYPDSEFTLAEVNPRALELAQENAQRNGHLRENGRLWVVIRKQQGAKSAEAKIAQVFGNCEVVRRDKGYLVLCAKKG